MDLNLLYSEFQKDTAAVQAYEALTDAGGRVFVVGGAVRDAILNKPSKDIDLMVTGIDATRIEQVLKSLPGYVKFAGKHFGVFHYHLNDFQVEIAMPRTEVSTGPGHTEFAVTPDHNLDVESDLRRRDFTANAMAFDIASGRLIDPYNGSQDIREGNLRLVSPTSFQEDPLRIVRALVAYAVHGLQPDEYTLDQMAENASSIRNLPAERVQMELDKLLSGNDPAGAISIAYETGVLDEIIPELAKGFEFDQQNIYHDLTVGEHSLAVLRAVTNLTTDPDIRLAALLHDVGKPDTFWQDDQGNGHFYQNDDIQGSRNHEDVGADMARAFMNRMRYPNSRIDRVVSLIQNHMFPYFSSDKGARKFIRNVGDENTARDLLTLREADAQGKSDGSLDPSEKERIDTSRSYVDKVTSEKQPTGKADLAINGHDLINLGIKPGPEMKMILNDLETQVLDDPSLNTPETLTRIVEDTYA